MASPLSTQPKAKKTPSPEGVRLLPPVMVTVAVVLGLKALGMAEGLVANAQESPAQPAAGAAAANAPQTNGPQTSAQQADAASGAAPGGAGQCTQPSIAEMAGLSQSEVEVLQDLQARRQALDLRANSLETQDDVMTAAAERLDQRIAELHRLQDTVNGLLGQLDQAQEQRVAGLVDVYSRMRAKDAAHVFDGLDDTTLVQVAGRMRNQNLAEIMGNMQPDRARHLTQMLADRARPPNDGSMLLAQANGLTPAAAAAPPAAPHP
jgi:flagellar motility protein MotE (MotC chaperone)